MPIRFELAIAAPLGTEELELMLGFALQIGMTNTSSFVNTAACCSALIELYVCKVDTRHKIQSDHP
jgi:hypothetical protein